MYAGARMSITLILLRWNGPSSDELYWKKFDLTWEDDAIEFPSIDVPDHQIKSATDHFSYVLGERDREVLLSSFRCMKVIERISEADLEKEEFFLLGQKIAELKIFLFDSWEKWGYSAEEVIKILIKHAIAKNPEVPSSNLALDLVDPTEIEKRQVEVFRAVIISASKDESKSAGMLVYNLRGIKGSIKMKTILNWIGIIKSSPYGQKMRSEFASEKSQHNLVPLPFGIGSALTLHRPG
jgi:hypothetical protein